MPSVVTSRLCRNVTEKRGKCKRKTCFSFISETEKFSSLRVSYPAFFDVFSFLRRICTSIQKKNVPLHSKLTKHGFIDEFLWILWTAFYYVY